MLEVICGLSLLINILLAFVILERLKSLSEYMGIRFSHLDELVESTHSYLRNWRDAFFELSHTKNEVIDALIKCKVAEMVAEMQKKKEAK